MSVHRNVRRAYWICLLGAAIVLGVRLVKLACDTETGLESLRLQWRDAVLGPLSRDRQLITAREPADQAEFWLAETQRVLEANPNDAQVAMGAAMVLDSPGIDFQSKYLRAFELVPGVNIPRIDREGIKRAEDAFEVRCQARCLQLAARATELDRGNLAWWRLRALLLFRSTVGSHEGHARDADSLAGQFVPVGGLGRHPRDADWLALLDECARHDPENSLYDYLAANRHWDDSAGVDFSGPVNRLIVKDAALFEQGISRFERGQAKPFCAVGDAGFTATAEFLHRSRLPLTSHLKVITSRTIALRRTSLLRGLWHWQQCRANEIVQSGDVRAALHLLRQNLNLFAQSTRSGPEMAFDAVPVVGEVCTATAMRELADSHPGVVSADELQDMLAVQEAALVRKAVVMRCGEVLAKEKPPPRQGLNLQGNVATVIAGVFVGLAPRFVILLLTLGLVATVAVRWSATHDVFAVGPVGQLAAVALALVATVVVLGLAPAQIISHEIQAWGLSVLALMTPVAMACWFGWGWFRRRRFQFSLRAMLTAVFVLCLLFGVISIAHTREGAFSEFPFDLAIPARELAGIGVDAAGLGRVFDAANGRWLFALVQWFAYFGPYVSLVLWVAIVAAICGRKVTRNRSHGGDRSPRHHVAALLRSLGRPSLAFSATLFLAYLLVMPHIVLLIERTFQDGIAFPRRPASHWDKVELCCREIEADEQQMKAIREGVEAEMSSKPTPEG